MLVCGLMVFQAGCTGGSRNVTIGVWQKNIEQYVKQHGDGDPAILRDLTLPDSRRGFSTLGTDRPAESSDANGLLLGHRTIEGYNWFIYIVGLVRKQSVEEIRLAALSPDGGKYTWKVSENNAQALSRYRDYYDKLWRQRFPQRGAPPPAYLGFPRPEDQFHLSIDDGLIVVDHPLAKARWELKLPASRSKVASGE